MEDKIGEPLFDRIRRAQEAYHKPQAKTSAALHEIISGWIWNQASTQLLEKFQTMVKYLEAQSLQGEIPLPNMPEMTDELATQLTQLEETTAQQMLNEPMAKMTENALRQLLNVLTQAKAYNPAFAKMESSMSAYFKQGMPTDPESVQTMRTNIQESVKMLGQLFQEKAIPQEKGRAILDEFSKAFNENLATIDRSTMNIKTTIKSTEGENQRLSDATQQLDRMQTLFQKVQNGSATSGDLEDLMQLFMQNVSLYRTLSPESKELFKPFFSALNESEFQGKPASTLFAESTLSTWLAKFMERFPDANIDDFKAWAQGELETLKVAQEAHPFLGALSKEFQALLASGNFPKNMSIFGSSFEKLKGEKIAPTEDLKKAIEKAFNLSPEEAEKLIEALMSSGGNISLNIAQNYAKISGLGRALSQLKEERVDAVSGKMDIEAKKAVLGSTPNDCADALGDLPGTLQGNLPDELVDILLNIWMKIEMGNLTDLAIYLKALNGATGFFNDLLDKIKDFAQGASTFSIANWINSIIDNKSGQIPPEKKRQWDEMIANATKLLNDVIGDIDNAISAINKFLTQLPGPLAAELKAFLAPIVDNLTFLKNSCAELKKLYEDMVLQPVYKDDDPTKEIIGYKIINKTPLLPPPTWQQIIDRLSNFEKLVNKGDDKHEGMQKIYDSISNQISHYSGLSQTQQTMLQLTMTRVNQEWTLVASLLQTLYEISMSSARGIKSG